MGPFENSSFFLIFDLRSPYVKLLYLNFRKIQARGLGVVAVVMSELIWVVPLVLVHDFQGISDEMVHTIVAWTCTHLGYSK